VPSVGRQWCPHGLDILLPKLRSCTLVRAWNANGARLQSLHTEVAPRVRALLGPRLLLLLPEYNVQCTEHNCCEFMQQHHRCDPLAANVLARPRRCSFELALMFVAASVRLQVSFGQPWDHDANEALERIRMSCVDVSALRAVCDSDLLRRLSLCLPNWGAGRFGCRSFLRAAESLSQRLPNLVRH
jgi:hypothetical protein